MSNRRDISNGIDYVNRRDFVTGSAALAATACLLPEAAATNLNTAAAQAAQSSGTTLGTTGPCAGRSSPLLKTIPATTIQQFWLDYFRRSTPTPPASAPAA